MRPAQLLTTFLLYSTLSTATLEDSWAEGKALAADAIENFIYGRDIEERQGITLGNSNAPPPNPTQSIDTSQPTESASRTHDSAHTTGDSSASNSDSSASASGSHRGSRSGSSHASETGKTTGKHTAHGSSTKTMTNDIPPNAGPGGVSMITPNPMSRASQYYKIGNNNFVTFAWNYTSLSSTPHHIDVLASCSKNNEYYTIAANQTTNKTNTVIWDTGAYQASATIPLIVDMYTLIIQDSAVDVSAAPQPGHLGVWNQFTFGMYTPQPKVDLDQFVCATCSGAMSSLQRQTFSFIFAMAGITVFTFTWFAGDFGIF